MKEYGTENFSVYEMLVLSGSNSCLHAPYGSKDERRLFFWYRYTLQFKFFSLRAR